MTTYQALTTAFYASLALYAFFGTWGKESKFQVGGMLLFCFGAANVFFWTLPFAARPAFLPVLDVLFALSAAKAWKETGSQAPLYLIGLSILALVTNTAFSLVGILNGNIVTWGQLHQYEVALNVIFALQCLVTGSWGIADVLGRFVRVYLRPHFVRLGLQPNRRSDEGP